MCMLRSFLAAGALTASMLCSNASQAALIVRGDGMIYDSVLNITWLDLAVDALNWSEAVAWVEGLTHGGFSDWRLPTLAPVNGISFEYEESVDGSTDWSYNITSPWSELSHLYYVSLGNLGAFNTAGDFIDGTLTNTGPFQNLQSGTYWYGVEYAPDPENFAWSFLTDFGLQTDSFKFVPGLSLAVRDGDVAMVPTPATALLLLSGMLGIAGMRKRNARGVH